MQDTCSDLTKKSNWVWPKGRNVQDFKRLRTPPANFWPKGQRLKFDVNIKDKTCNLLKIKNKKIYIKPPSSP
ncbi:hypothetical protein HanRHA438_Chr01g0007291 [Helianthus annuus]|nr:hypothetical protein HanRHA438_Chr01g0007291 [Helianthus annuus]